jgi:hypothetical protein
MTPRNKIIASAVGVLAVIFVAAQDKETRHLFGVPILLGGAGAIARGIQQFRSGNQNNSPNNPGL